MLVWEKFLTENDASEKQYSKPIKIYDARIQDHTKTFIDANGENISLSTVIYTTSKVNVGDRIDGSVVRAVQILRSLGGIEIKRQVML